MSEALEKKFPAVDVDVAYEIAVDSYDLLIKRLDSINGRLQTIVALFASATAGVLVIAARSDLNFRSNWFYAALTLMLVATVLAVITRLVGGNKCYSAVLSFSSWASPF